MSRPQPPQDLLDDHLSIRFEPAHDLRDWAYATFIEDGARLFNPEHAHLTAARIGFLWTNVGNARNGRTIVGQCEMKPPAGRLGKWPKAMLEMLYAQWFGPEPLDFLITLDANYAAAADDATFCAIVEHELMHAGQAQDREGGPAYTREGMPVFAMRPHDIETFVGLASRYGAVEAGVKQLAAALSQAPSIGQADLSFACGSCGR